MINYHLPPKPKLMGVEFSHLFMFTAKKKEKKSFNYVLTKLLEVR